MEKGVEVADGSRCGRWSWWACLSGGVASMGMCCGLFVRPWSLIVVTSRTSVEWLWVMRLRRSALCLV